MTLKEALEFREILNKTLSKVIILRTLCRDKNLLIKSILQMPDFDYEIAYNHFCVLVRNDCESSAEDLISDYNRYSINAGLGKHLPD